ncbi:MAG: aminotransferase class V-fold PLP-dependent enzyme [Nannocystaceae bacterium]
MSSIPTDDATMEQLRLRVPQVHASTLRDELITDSTRRQVLDVRDSHELGTGTIARPLYCSLRDLAKTAKQRLPDLDQPLCVVCHGGERSLVAAGHLLDLGYTDVVSLRGGMRAWLSAGFQAGNAVVVTPPDDDALSWEAIRDEFPIATRRIPLLGGGDTELSYLDHAASTHPPSRVLEHYSRFMAHDYSNVHRGAHHLSRTATDEFARCYRVIAEFIGGQLDDSAVIFASNTTQAIDLCASVMRKRPGITILTDLEHHSNDLPHRRYGETRRARVLNDGRLDYDHLEHLIASNRVKLVAMSGASNVTGWMPDIHRVATLAHAHGARILVDAAQLLAHHPIDVRPLEDPAHLDFLAGAGHKAYAPFGAAFLFGPRELFDAAPPYLPGGGTATEVTADDVQWVASPDRHQGGTPNIGGVIALAHALEFLEEIGMDRVRAHELKLTDAVMTRLLAIDGLTVYGAPDPHARLGVLSFNVTGVSDPLTAAILSEERGVACRNGRFCAHPYMARLLAAQGGATPATGHPPGAVRASFGLYNTEMDVERLVEACEMIRRKGWKGRYQIRGEHVAGEMAARCNDRWMEADTAS